MEIIFQQKSKDEQQLIASVEAVLSPPRKGYTKAQRPSPRRWLLGNTAENARTRFTACNKWGKICKKANLAGKRGNAKVQLVFDYDLGCTAGQPVYPLCLNFDLFESDVPFAERVQQQKLKHKLALAVKGKKQTKKNAFIRKYTAEQTLEEVTTLLASDNDNGKDAQDDDEGSDNDDEDEE